MSDTFGLDLLSTLSALIGMDATHSLRFVAGVLLSPGGIVGDDWSRGGAGTRYLAFYAGLLPAKKLSSALSHKIGCWLAA